MNCENAILYYYDYLQQPGAVPAGIKEHIDTCAACQAQVERLREELSRPAQSPYKARRLQLHYQLLDQWIACDRVRPFLPSLLVPALEMTFPTPVTAHVEHCPACREDLQKIASLGLSDGGLVQASAYLADDQDRDHGLDAAARVVLARIKQCQAAPTLTRTHLPQTDDPQQEWLSDAVTVDVRRRASARPKPQRPAPARRTVSVWVSSGIAAAVLFALLLVLPTAKLEALDVEHLYANLETVRNIHIRKTDDSELETIWIAQGLGVYLFRQGDHVVFVNPQSGTIYRLQDGAVQTVTGNSNLELERPWGLLPFKHISQLPADYEWAYVGDDVLDDGVKVRVYEWTWRETLKNQVQVKRIWRGYLDERSYLPYRIEWLDQFGDAPAERVMEMIVRYPTDAECRQVFEQYGFEMLSYGDQQEPFNSVPDASKAGSTAPGLVRSTCPSTKTALNLPKE